MRPCFAIANTFIPYADRDPGVILMWMIDLTALILLFWEILQEDFDHTWSTPDEPGFYKFMWKTNRFHND